MKSANVFCPEGKRKILLRLVIIFLVVVAGSLVFAYSGPYNVAASDPHSKPVRKFLQLVSHQSVKHHAADITVPDNLQDTAVIQMGYQHFQEMCVQCHGAPRMERSEMARGLN